MDWVRIGTRRKRCPGNVSRASDFDVDALASAVRAKYDEFCGWMEANGTPVTTVYHGNGVLLATNADHTIALWDHLYSNWTGNNITDVIYVDQVMRYSMFQYKYMFGPTH